jgi:Fe-S-cluster-containing hydrogenase component 2
MPDLNFSKIRFRDRNALTAEAKVCAGCRTCEVICSLTHQGCVDLEKSRILLKSNAFKGKIPK